MDLLTKAEALQNWGKHWTSDLSTHPVKARSAASAALAFIAAADRATMLASARTRLAIRELRTALMVGLEGADFRDDPGEDFRPTYWKWRDRLMEEIRGELLPSSAAHAVPVDLRPRVLGVWLRLRGLIR